MTQIQLPQYVTFQPKVFELFVSLIIIILLIVLFLLFNLLICLRLGNLFPEELQRDSDGNPERANQGRNDLPIWLRFRQDYW
jgi:hypothetical protein